LGDNVKALPVLPLSEADAEWYLVDDRLEETVDESGGDEDPRSEQISFLVDE
jgi:hypothetical protein